MKILITYLACNLYYVVVYMYGIVDILIGSIDFAVNIIKISFEVAFLVLRLLNPVITIIFGYLRCLLILFIAY